MFANHLSDKGFVSRVYKELYNSVIKKKKNTQSKMSKRFEQTFLQGRYTNGQ